MSERPENESIAKLAYLIWESRGRPAGTADQDWVEAEAQFAAAKVVKVVKASKAASAAAHPVAAAIPTLDTPAKIKAERDKAERRKSRPRKSPTRESDGPNSP